ncbi:MAG: hypothetical protein P4M12_10445 [Gammaproteobacteria bacterium]|nr:hypothetical protein [Gammaproteobacteria bacterium]
MSSSSSHFVSKNNDFLHEELACPISLNHFQSCDPVISTLSGNSYDKKSIMKCGIDPVIRNVKLKATQLFPNTTLKNAIEELEILEKYEEGVSILVKKYEKLIEQHLERDVSSSIESYKLWGIISPSTLKIVEVPYSIKSGITYEKEMIVSWLKKNSNDPLSTQTLKMNTFSDNNLVPDTGDFVKNLDLIRLIDLYKKKYADKLLQLEQALANKQHKHLELLEKIHLKYLEQKLQKRRYYYFAASTLVALTACAVGAYKKCQEFEEPTDNSLTVYNNSNNELLTTSLTCASLNYVVELNQILAEEIAAKSSELAHQAGYGIAYYFNFLSKSDYHLAHARYKMKDFLDSNDFYNNVDLFVSLMKHDMDLLFQLIRVIGRQKSIDTAKSALNIIFKEDDLDVALTFLRRSSEAFSPFEMQRKILFSESLLSHLFSSNKPERLELASLFPISLFTSEFKQTLYAKAALRGDIELLNKLPSDINENMLTHQRRPGVG